MIDNFDFLVKLVIKNISEELEKQKSELPKIYLELNKFFEMVDNRM